MVILSVAIIVMMPIVSIWALIQFIIGIIRRCCEDGNATQQNTKPTYKYTIHTETPSEEARRTDYWGLDDEWSILK